MTEPYLLLRLAPKIFSALAYGVLWMVHHQGFSYSLHYLDDFLFLGPLASSHCQDALHFALQLYRELGLQVCKEKTEGPSTSITFLRIEIDIANHQLRLT